MSDQKNLDYNVKQERMRNLIQILNAAGKAYYSEGHEIMTNFEYDKLYDELVELEQTTGLILSGSPTQRVGYEVLSELPKQRHPSAMLSLDKTKSIDTLKEWIGQQKGILSWKLDGLTIVLKYRNGKLEEAVTRGNGEIGEVVTQNAKKFENIPLQIEFSGELVLRGEAIIKYSDFARVNEEISDADAKYKNPRNLCSGSVRQLDPSVTATRHVNFLAFSLVSAEGVDFHNSRNEQFLWLRQQGFETVDYRMVTSDTIADSVAEFENKISENDFPSDGLVLLLEDIAYGESLGRTAKFPRNAIAFKWSDETAETTLREIEWSPSRTGLINPVAIFDPVELEGTTVSRASVHNLSVMEELELGIGDKITVYKANMIIPQIAENLTRSRNMDLPECCPACHQRTEVRQEKDARYLMCVNPECPAKKIKNFALMASRDALNIEGLSEATLEKLIGLGMIREYADLFHLERFREEIIRLEGFGEKSFENLKAACDKAAETELYRVIYGLGIAGVGLANAKLICRYFQDDIERIRTAGAEEFCRIDGVGEVIAEAVSAYFKNEENQKIVSDLFECIHIKETEQLDSSEQVLAGKTVVITGSLNHFSNRKELEEVIEKLGGKCAGSVSKKTAYLINNDTTSESTKNKKAKQLGVEIINEEDFLKLIRMEQMEEFE